MLVSLIAVAATVGGVLGTQAPGVLPHPAAGINATHTIVVLSADTKALWMAVLEAGFNTAGLILSTGQVAAVRVHNNGSVLQPELTPAIWSPQFSNFIALEQNLLNLTIVRRRYPDNCAP